jgi:hypothetical protein
MRGLAAHRLSRTYTLIGEINTPIVKTARLWENQKHVKNNFHLEMLNWIIVFPLKKRFYFFGHCKKRKVSN